MIILGGLDDQMPLLVWGQISKSPFSITDPIIANYEVYQQIYYGLMHPLQTSRPLLEFFTSLILTFFGPNSLWVINILFLLLTFLFSYFLFRRFRYGVAYALIYTFSSYMWSHFGIHLSLMTFWVFPLFVYFLLEIEKRGFKLRDFALLGVFIAFCILLSNYYGLFILMLFGLYTFFNLLLEWLFKKVFYLDLLKGFIVALLVGVGISAIFIIPNFKTYSSGGDVRLLSGSYTQQRSYEDFFTFSSRPWYFLLLPVKNPVLGGATQIALDRLEKTNYFLADDYFANEHQGNYFGSIFLVTTFVVLIYALVKGDKEVKFRSLVFVGIAVILFLFMLPPFFTISGIKIWTPNVLIYEFLPMFRATARLSVVILLCLLLILAYGFDYIYKTGKKDTKYIWIVLATLLVVTLIETYVPLKVYRLDKSPQVYSYLRENTSKGSKFAIYPYSKTDEALFWLSEHQRLLINPRGYKTPDFNSEEFTERLVLEDGLQDFVELGGEYLVVHDEGAADLQVDEFKESIVFVDRIGSYNIYSVGR